MPLAPMGCSAEVHVKPDNRKSWDYHTKSAWYLYTSTKHYRVHNLAIKSTKAERLSDTVVFMHKRITQPTVTHGDLIAKQVGDLNATLKGMSNSRNNADFNDLQQLAEATSRLVTRNKQRAAAEASLPREMPEVANLRDAVQTSQSLKELPFLTRELERVTSKMVD